jgi:hypothetical protein
MVTVFPSDGGDERHLHLGAALAASAARILDRRDAALLADPHGPVVCVGIVELVEADDALSRHKVGRAAERYLGGPLRIAAGPVGGVARLARVFSLRVREVGVEVLYEDVRAESPVLLAPVKTRNVWSAPAPRRVTLLWFAKSIPVDSS